MGAGSSASRPPFKFKEKMATTNFKDWLFCHVVPSDYNDVYDCYMAIHDKQGNFRFDVKNNLEQGKLFITPVGTSDTLMIASEKARETILNMIEIGYCGGMDIEGYWSYHHAMEKDD